MFLWSDEDVRVGSLLGLKTSYKNKKSISFGFTSLSQTSKNKDAHMCAIRNFKVGNLMKPVFDTENGSEYTRTVRKFSNVMIVSLLMTLFILSFTEEAWSFETYHGRLNDQITSHAVTTPTSYHPTRKSRSSGQQNSILADSLKTGAADTCLPLLSSLRHAPLHNAVDRNQHSAGKKAAALGLIFGVRFALSPLSSTASHAENTNARFDVWRPDSSTAGSAGIDNRSALAVAAYRQCQKKQALQALNSFR